MKKMLLHSCCGPCSTHVIETLHPDYYITIFYYNPNILPEKEYMLRENEQYRFLKLYKEKIGIDIGYIKGDYCPETFYNLTKGREAEKEGGQRCFDCIQHRLEVTSSIAQKEGFDIFCTTLSVSPHKNAQKINEMGNELSQKYSIPYLISDFKKKNGYLHSIELSKEYGLYRQSYCGCGFSSN